MPETNGFQLNSEHLNSLGEGICRFLDEKIGEGGYMLVIVEPGQNLSAGMASNIPLEEQGPIIQAMAINFMVEMGEINNDPDT